MNKERFPWRAAVQLMRLDRPIGILLLLWPTLTALWIAAAGWPDPKVLLIFVLGVIIMRSAGCVVNDLADQRFDGQVARTQNRPLITGDIQQKQAIILCVSLCLFAFGLVLMLNRLTILLSVVAVLLAASYPFMKRFMPIPQVVLGMAFGWAIPMAFAAQTGQVPAVAWWLFAANIVWSVIYDTFYAMVDREDDLKIGVQSTAILFGQYDRIITGSLQVLLLGIMWVVGDMMQFSVVFYAALNIALYLFIYQQWLIRDRERTACLQAFLNNNWVGALFFVAIFIHFGMVGW